MLTDTEGDVKKSTRQTTKERNKKVRRRGSGHECGPPHLSAWGRLPGYLIKQGIGCRNKEMLSTFMKEYREMPVKQRALYVKASRACQADDRFTTKVD